jgi:hypothetical protein
MRQNTRYSVRLAQRRGVQITRLGEGASIDDFYGLLKDTSERNSFGVHAKAYYADFIDRFDGDALCLFAFADGALAAALIAARVRSRSGLHVRGVVHTEPSAWRRFLRQFEAMRWARDSGCLRYDLWGIPMEDPDAVYRMAPAWQGRTPTTKEGCSDSRLASAARIVTYPPTLERRYKPVPRSWPSV